MAPQTPHAHTLARGARAFRGGRRRLSVLLAVTALLLGAVALVKVRGRWGPGSGPAGTCMLEGPSVDTPA